MEDEHWTLLGDPLPMEAPQLGSLVRDCKRPAQDCYFPEDLADKPQHLVQKAKNYQAKLGNASDAKLSGLRKMLPKGEGSGDIVHMDAQESCIYQLQNTSTSLETIRGLVDGQEWLRQQYSKDQGIYLLIGLQTLTDGFLARMAGNSPALAVLSSSITGVPSVSGSVDWESFGNDRNLSRYEIHEETIVAVSYIKTRHGFFDFLRRWSKRLRKGRPATRELGETDDRCSVSTRSSSPTLAVPGTFGGDSPPASSSGVSTRRDPMLTSTRQGGPPHRLESEKGIIDEFIIQSDGSQETMQFKGSRTPPESEDGSTDTDDNELAAISVLFGPSADGTPLGIEQWTNMLIGSSALDGLYEKATTNRLGSPHNRRFE